MKRKSQAGFTLFNMLMALTILLIVSSLLPIMFAVLDQWTINNEGLHPFEWEVATNQIYIDIKEAKELYVYGDSIVLVNLSGQNVSYKQYYQSLRRQVNGRGHEIVLQYINDFHVKENEYTIQIEVEDLAGDQYVRRMVRWLDVVNRD